MITQLTDQKDLWVWERVEEIDAFERGMVQLEIGGEKVADTITTKSTGIWDLVFTRGEAGKLACASAIRCGSERYDFKPNEDGTAIIATSASTERSAALHNLEILALADDNQWQPVPAKANI